MSCASWRKIITLAVWIGFTAVNAWTYAGEPVLKEGFENGTTGWMVWSMKKTATFAADNTQAKEGKSSAKASIDSPDEQIAVYKYIPLEPEKRYVLRFQYKVKDLQVRPGGNAGPAVNFNKEGGGNGSAGRESFKIKTDSAESDWQTFEQEFTTPKETAKAQFMIMTTRLASGTIWIDEVVLEPVSDSQKVPEAAAPPTLDGKLDDACWKSAPALDRFAPIHLDPSPLTAQTQAYLTYDKKNIYAAFRCEEPNMAALAAKETQRDGRVWADDSVEFFLVSPGGMKAQFIVNAANTQWDGQLFNKMPGDPYQADASWNGQWSSAVARDAKGWTVEIAVPLSNFQETIQSGKIWHVNLARHRQGAAVELSQWNHVDGVFNVVEKFAALEFGANNALLKRFVEQKNPDALRIVRAAPQYQSLLTAEPGNYLVGSWGIMVSLTGHYPKEMQARFTPQTWQQERRNIMDELGQAGMFGPQLDYTGDYAELNQKYGMKFWLYLQKFGQTGNAVFVEPAHRRVDPIDPAFTQAVIDGVRNYFLANPQAARYLAFALGKDEPMNATPFIFSLTKNPNAKEVLEDVDRQIKAGPGGGKYGLYDAFATQHPEDEPLRRIAFMRWWNQQYARSVGEIGRAFKAAASQVPYLPCNMNHTRSIGAEDVALLSAQGDWIGGDPYPTSTLGLYGRERALYQTGFSIKYLKDVSGGKKVCAVPQGFKYFGVAPRPENIREWAAQSLKNGAEVLFWYNEGPARMQIPDAYKETLRISNLVGKMNRLRLPDTTRTAIFYSNHSTWGTNDEGKMGYYSLYVLLGEQCKTWFRFVSDTQLELGGDGLSRYRLVYVPQLKYLDQATADWLVQYVEKGGILVVLDPQAGAQMLNGESAEAFRTRLIGGRLGEIRPADQIRISEGGYRGLAAGMTLELTPVVGRDEAGRVMAYDLTPPADARIFATYSDGKPAAYERTVGQGKVIYFAAQPFGNAALAVKPGAWREFCLALAKEAGEAADQMIWDFELPAAGGEIPVNYAVPPEGPTVSAK